MKPRDFFLRVASVGALGAFLATLAAAPAQAERSPEARRRGNFNLLRASSTWTMQSNRVQCGMDNQGNICTDVFGSPTGGGGFWPGGTPNQYIFNSGLQIAGIIAADAGFAWANDTVGAYFFDARGTQPQGQQVTEIYSSINPADAADWPNGAVIRDADIFNAALLGRNAISQEDTWVRYWDGPALLSGRAHPMGILVEHRGLAWNFPTGNEDIIYWVFTFYNISASDASAYSTLDPAIQAEIAALGAAWVAEVEDRSGVDIPSGGYTINNLYSAFAMDPDVGNASVNASTAILPFQMGVAYKTDFNEPTWLYPPEINGPPFGPYPGFVGVKYLKSPIDPGTGQPVGLTLFSNTSNGAPFPDPVGVSQLWRYLSGNVDASFGDPTCLFPNPQARRLCALVQSPVDTRFFQSSGPFSLAPGRSATIVVAYVHAAPVAAEVEPYYSGTLAPGIPPSGAEIAANPSLLRVIERANGWLGQNDIAGPGGVGAPDGVIQQEEVVTLERSLLRKALQAQAIYDNHFLLPFAPEGPEFFLVPGDNQVTVVWQPSYTESVGDPYYQIAADPTSALYDPNYRNNDVEGYRIYRGRSRAQMEMVAQFDYASTVFHDYTGAWDYGTNCAPELGITGGCPVDFNGTNRETHNLVGEIPQVPAGGRVELHDGSVLITNSVDALADAGFPALANTGMPFVYVDEDVSNSVNYYYSVTAFDVNSVASGPTTLESPLTALAVTPRAPAPNQTASAGISFQLVDRDGNALDPDAAYPTIDPSNGTFSGPMPPTANFRGASAAVFADVLLQEGGLAYLRIDSIFPSYYHSADYYFSAVRDDGVVLDQFAFHVPQTYGQEDGTQLLTPISTPVPADRDGAIRAGLGPVPYAAQAVAEAEIYGTTYLSRDAEWEAWVEGSFMDVQDPPLNDDNGLRDQGGSRWFSGANESMANPTLGIGRGQLTGVNTIFAPIPYLSATDAYIRRTYQTTPHIFRAADIRVYWGAPGVIDSVIDLTHNVEIVYGDDVRGGVYGFIWDQVGGTRTSVSPPDGIVTYVDFAQGACFSGMGNWSQTGCATRGWAPTATLGPVDVTGDRVSDGNGFGLWINAEPYFFQTDALPTNTEWTLRSYTGLVYQDGSGAYQFIPQPSNPAVPGLRVAALAGAAGAVSDIVEDDLANVHTVPDPYYVTSGFEITPGQKVIRFVNLPSQAIIRIYSLSGILVDVVEHNDPGLGGEATWDVRNRNNQFVASGVYFYHVETPTGAERIGRFTVINSKGLAIGTANQ